MKHPPDAPIAVRLLSRMRLANRGCWEYTGSNDGQGYGTLHVKGRTLKAHRESYRAFVGPIPEGLSVCHHCDNPSCFNPEHLFVATHRENHQDRVRKGRSGRGRAKVCEAQVREIRARYLAGETQSAIAADFALSASGVRDITSRRNWSHVT